jgi:hypothetical protein
VTQWRRQLIEQAGAVFAGKHTGPDDTPKDRDALLAKIGQLTMERDFLQRVLFLPAYLEDVLRRHRTEHAGFYGTMVWLIVVIEKWLTANRM